jgi:holo-[acyl-carrier protein] synthase
VAHLSVRVVGVGIDLADPGRLAAALDRRPGLAGRLFTDSEQRATARGELTAVERFALKEAVMKALGCGMARISFTDITPSRRDGEIVVALEGRAALRAAELGVERWDLSVGPAGSLVMGGAIATADSSRVMLGG